MKSKTIAFLHGMNMTPLSWGGWMSYFQTKGFACFAPGWPGRDKPPQLLRAKHPDPIAGQLTLSEAIEHCANQIQSLPQKPILIGHSMGGLIVQLLLQRNIASAGVVIHSAPPFGVIPLYWSTLKSIWPMINPFISKYRPRLVSFAEFQYFAGDTLSPEEQKNVYDNYTVPESRLVCRETLSTVTRIDFKRERPPLLLISGSDDPIIPAKLNEKNYLKYRNSPSVTDYREFSGRGHFVIWQKKWEEVADYICEWLNEKVV